MRPPTDGRRRSSCTASGVRETAARYGADLEELPGMGHDLMLDARWREPLKTMLDWLAAQPVR